MTTKKKLIGIVVAAALLTTLVVLDPGGKIGSLTSRMISGIDNPTIDNQVLWTAKYPSGAINDTIHNAYTVQDPRRIAVHGNKIFIVEFNQHRVKIIDKNTGNNTIIQKNSQGQNYFSYPFDIAIDAQNKFFYITDTHHHAIHKFNLETYAYVDSVGDPGSGLGNFYYPTAIALDVKNDRLYVSDGYVQCRIQRFELSTLTPLASWGTCGVGAGQLQQYYYGPRGMVVDGDGNLYVADTYNNRVQKFDYQGAPLGVIAAQGNAPENVMWPSGLSIDAAGYLYVADTNHHRIQKFDIRKNGSPLVWTYGSVGSGNGLFSSPEGVFVDTDTNIYVADRDNQRIQMFRQHIIIPNAPTGLVATPSKTEIVLKWEPATSKPGGSAIIDYVIEYKKTSDSSWSTMNEGVSPNTQATFTNTLVSEAYMYDFRVFARNDAGELSVASDIKTSRLASDCPVGSRFNATEKVCVQDVVDLVCGNPQTLNIDPRDPGWNTPTTTGQKINLATNAIYTIKHGRGYWSEEWAQSRVIMAFYFPGSTTPLRPTNLSAYYYVQSAPGTLYYNVDDQNFGDNTISNADGSNPNYEFFYYLYTCNCPDGAVWNDTAKACVPQIYSVTFKKDDVSANDIIKKVALPARTVVTLPDIPVREGYNFGGWFTEINGGGTQFAADTVVNVHTVLYAKWTKKTYTITVPANLTNGAISPNSNVTGVEHGTTKTFTLTPTTGYRAQVQGCTGTLNTTTNIYTTGLVTDNCALTVNFTQLIQSVTISGAVKIGQPLTANTVPTGSTVTYQWKRADTSSGVYTLIDGATDKTYTLAESDQGKYIKVEVLGTQNYSGTAMSTAVGAVEAGIAPLAPTNLVGRVANGQINLSWNAANTNGGTAIKDYKVEFRIRNSNTGWNSFNNASVSPATNVSVTGLTNEVEYEFRVKAQNILGLWSPTSTVISKTPNPDDKCNNINGVQTELPKNTKRLSPNCLCVNEGIIDVTPSSSMADQACPVTCTARQTRTVPKFKIEYDAGYPKIYDSKTDTVGTPANAKKLILSVGGADGTIVDTGDLIPLFNNGQPFYDPDILLNKPQLSLQRYGGTLKVLLYGHRDDGKIEHVRGKITIEGSPDTRWTSVGEISLDDGGKGVNSTTNDFARILDNPKVLQFDLAVSSADDVFVARYDIGSDGCMEKPLIIFDKNTTDTVTGNMADQLLPIGTATALTANTFNRSGFTFAGWNTKADGTGTNYADRANYTISTAANVTLYAKWTAIATAPTVTTTAVTSITQTTATSGVTVTSNGGSAVTASGVVWNTTANPTTALTTKTTGGSGVIIGLTPGTTYHVRAYATNSVGTSYGADLTFTTNSTQTACAGSIPSHGYQLVGYTGGTYTTWTYDSPTSGVHPSCSFACDNGYAYNVSNNTCALNSAPSCTGTRPEHSVIVTDIGTSTTSLAWRHESDASLLTLSTACRFRCESGTAYNSIANTCATTISAYTVTYNANGATGGTVPVNQTKTHGTTLVLATNSGTLVKTGYSFAGWNTAADGTGTNYAAGSDYTANAAITLYAKWTVVDSVAPTVTMNLPDNYNSLTVPVTLTPSESGVSYFFIEGPTPVSGMSVQQPTAPLANASGWIATLPTTYTFPAAGSRTLFVWVKDAAGNVSTALVSDVVVITLTSADAPTIVRVTSPITNSIYRSGAIIPISVEFSKSVTVTGIPTLILETGANDVTVPFKQKETDGKTLTFEYVVSDGNTSADLNYAATDSLRLADSTITISDTVTNAAANRTLPALTTTESLAGNKAIIIDTTRPAAPAAPIVPQQANIALASTETSTFIATGNTMTVNVACAAGEKVKIYNGVSFSPLKTADCANNIVTLTLDLSSQAGSYNYFATITDTAGNESEYSPRIVVLKRQTTSNAPGVPDLEPLFDLGISSTDNLTSETRPRFTLSCISGYTISLYDSTTLIGTAPCMADTAQVIPVQPFSSGVHTLTAKQFNDGIISSVSAALTLTIDTAPLTVTLARASEQSEPATSSTIKFTATFSRPIDTNSFICSDITVTNGSCTGVTLLSGNIYTITIVAASQGTVRIVIYPGRVQTPAGNLNSESSGTNTVTYGTATATAECSTLRRFTTSKPKNSSLNGQTLCKSGNPSSVSYSSSNLKWTYQCRSTTDGSTANCSVTAILDSAPSCDLKPVDELPFDECSIGSTSNMFNFHKYLSCLGVVTEKKSCTDAGCTQNAKRQELISIGVRLRGIPLESGYECQKSHTDTVRGVASWVCEAAEKAQTAGLISATNKQFRPLDTMTRSEAYSVLMKSICVHPETTYKNWQTEVAKAAKEYGFTTRSVATFEPNRQILRQELFVLAARLAEYAADNPGLCEPLPEELICES